MATFHSRCRDNEEHDPSRCSFGVSCDHGTNGERGNLARAYPAGGTERTSASERPQSRVVDIFSPFPLVVLIASRSKQHTLQAVTQDTTLPPRRSRTLPFPPILYFPLYSHLRLSEVANTRHSAHVYKTASYSSRGVSICLSSHSTHAHLPIPFISC